MQHALPESAQVEVRVVTHIEIEMKIGCEPPNELILQQCNKGFKKTLHYLLRVKTGKTFPTVQAIIKFFHFLPRKFVLLYKWWMNFLSG